MFNFRLAISNLSGQTMGIDELFRQLEAIRERHRSELSPEIGARELLLLARRNNWVEEDAEGKLHVSVSKETAA